MSSSIILILLVILIAGIVAVIFLLLGKKPAVENLSDEKIMMLIEKIAGQSEKLTQLSEQNRDMRTEIDRKLAETHQTTQQHFGETTRIIQGITGQSAKLIADVTERLTKLDETNKQVINFSAQLQSLQDILKNPKQRGILGEYYLEETLKNVLPPNSYKMQYPFKDGTIVDAVVFVKEKIIPIDAKFSLENYEKLLNTSDPESRERLEKQFKQDLKNRIDETSKYVKPAEGTMDFAFMFIPSESIYYDLLVGQVGGKFNINSRDLIEYAFRDRKVIIVSPTSFLAYLQTVLQGLRAMQIEESAKEIMANVEKLGKHLLSYEEFMKKLGSSLSTTVNHYNNASKEFKKVDKDVVRIGGGESEFEAILVEGPKDD